jgi:hypothetical protein
VASEKSLRSAERRKDRGSGIRGVEDDVTRGSVINQAQLPDRHSRGAAVTSEEKTTMESLCHWLKELAELYTRHAGRHGPNRLLPAEVLPRREGEPGHTEPSPQGTGPDGCTVEPSTPKACTRHGSLR